MHKPRVLMLELDAVSLPFIQKNLEALPTLKKLLAGGRLIDTQSTADILSASVWPSFASAATPGEHGHYFPFQWNAGKMRFMRSSSEEWEGRLDFEPFWYEFARRGSDCLLLDPVQSGPYPDAPSLEIHDWSAQSSGMVRSTDSEVVAELKRRFGTRPIGMEVPVAKSRRLARSLCRQLIRSVQRKADAIIWLGQSREWQFYLASIQEAHRAGHNFWPAEGTGASAGDAQPLLEVYRAMDEQLERILSVFVDGNTTVILFSLHGMGSNNAQNHFLPQVMSRLNHLYLTGERLKRPSNMRSGIIAKLRDMTPAPIQYAATRLLGENVQDWVVNREFTGACDWAATPAFPMASGGEGLLRLNLIGRESNGMLAGDGEAFNAYISWLRERLLAIRVEETGEPLVSDFILFRERYPGARSDLLPDIALRWAPKLPVSRIHSEDIGLIRNRLRTGRSGNHTRHSFALIYGKQPEDEVVGILRHITDYREFVAALL